MGFDQGRIEFDQPNGLYCSGEIIHGKLVFNQEKLKTFRGLFVKLKGYCDVYWTTRHERRVNDRTEYYTVEHSSHEIYCNEKVYLMGGSSGEVHLEPGHYEFSFQLCIPGYCPSSFEGSNGQIRYEVKAVVDRAFKFDQEKKIELNVVNIRDLNLVPSCKQPMTFEFEDTYCSWCLDGGTCEVTVKLPQSGYCPEQTIRLEVSCANKSNVKINFLQFKLVEERKFTATHNYDIRYEERDIAKYRRGPVPANTTRNWSLEMDIPNIFIYNVDTCNYIDITHSFVVKISPSGFHTSTKESRHMVLGHIPLRELNDGPPEDESPTINQPVHQGIPTDYEFQEKPYPGPNGHSQFQTPSAPDQTPPPYPGTTPYPPENMSVPVQNPPYPGASPYPAENPNSKSSPCPYPIDPVPYMPNPDQPGFAVGDENKNLSNVPVLLPQHVPYPSNPSGNPYKASAPEPSTPDADVSTKEEHFAPFKHEGKN